MPAFSKPKNDIPTTTLNPMVFQSRFPHIIENIFVKMDIDNLKKCRQVSKSWKEFIDNMKILWIGEVGTKSFLLACKDGHSKLMEILFLNSARFNIDLNSRDWCNRTGFILACINGHSKIAEMLVQKSAEFDIDLNIQIGYISPIDKMSLSIISTAFQEACERDHTKIVDILLQNYTEVNIDVNAKDHRHCTAFMLACENGHLKIAEMLVQMSADLNIDLNAKNGHPSFGWTAFMMACEKRSYRDCKDDCAEFC